jgi:2',3'-cyclic-nucleotide 2'-phosphodiesterase (5'-nucleotidase family)
MRRGNSLFSTNRGSLRIPGDSKSCAGEPEELYFCILHTNDIHSELIPHQSVVDGRPETENHALGGVARLATAVNEIRESKRREGEPLLLFDVGDFLGGAPFAWLVLDGHASELTIMQKMGYDAVTIGNHEYDYGPDALAQYLLRAGYPETHQRTVVLASNTEAPPTDSLAAQGLCRKAGIFELGNGLKVGVFGLIGKEAILMMGETEGMRFLDQHETARRLVDELKRQGADVVVALSHCGLAEDRELAPVLLGSTIVVQAGHFGEYLGQLELAYNRGAGQVRVRNLENRHPFLIPIDSSFACDADIDSLVQQYTLDLNAYTKEVTSGEFDDVMSTVARSDFVLSNLPPLSETSLGNFVTDAMRFVAQEFTGKRVDMAGLASGSIRDSIFPDAREYSAGSISFYSIAQATGAGRGHDGCAGCPVVAVYLTAEDVRRVLEITILLHQLMGGAYFIQISGLRYSYDPANAVLLTVPLAKLPIPTTRAVAKMEVYTGDGIQPVHSEGYVRLNCGDDKLYHVVTDAYLFCFLPIVRDTLPQLEVVPKNADGEPVSVDRMDELMLRHPDGRELKVWEAALIYARAQESGGDGVPQIPDYYAGAAGRITKVRRLPVIGRLILIPAAVVAGIRYLILRRKRRRTSRDTMPVKPTAK